MKLRRAGQKKIRFNWGGPTPDNFFRRHKNAGQVSWDTEIHLARHMLVIKSMLQLERIYDSNTKAQSFYRIDILQQTRVT